MSADFAATLRAERARIGISQADAAGLLSVSPRCYQNWEDAGRQQDILQVTRSIHDLLQTG